MSLLDIEPIRLLERATTPGPWKIGGRFRDHLIDASFPVDVDGAPVDLPIFAAPQNDAGLNAFETNASFVVAARQDVPALIAEVDRLRAALEKIEDLVSDIRFAPSKTSEHRALMDLESFVQDAIRGVS